MKDVFEIKDGENTVIVEVIEIDGGKFYAIKADYYENEVVAEGDGYYWNDEIEKWTKEIIDNSTTVF